jgi:hypothetical protein
MDLEGGGGPLTAHVHLDVARSRSKTLRAIPFLYFK